MPPKKDNNDIAGISAKLEALIITVEKIAETNFALELNKLSDSIQLLTAKVDQLSTLKLKVDQIEIVTDKAVNDIADIKDRLIGDLIQSNKELCERLVKVEKNVLDLEKDVHVGSHRARENNIEFHGIPDYISDAELMKTTIALCKKVNVNIQGFEIQGVHRLPLRKGGSQKPVIAKFVNRRAAETIFANKKMFDYVDFTEFGFPRDTKIYINLNLSPQFKKLDFFCRKLKRERRISDTMINRQGINIKTLDERYHKINHVKVI